jgi:hypothetical protein
MGKGRGSSCDRPVMLLGDTPIESTDPYGNVLEEWELDWTQQKNEERIKIDIVKAELIRPKAKECERLYLYKERLRVLAERLNARIESPSFSQLPFEEQLGYARGGKECLAKYQKTCKELEIKSTLFKHRYCLSWVEFLDNKYETTV